MNIKIYKSIFISIIIFLIILGIYIVYIKKEKEDLGNQTVNKQTIITKEITVGITEFDTINPILTKSLEIQHLTKLIYEPLINITQDFNAKPGIAAEWAKISEYTYLIKLDNNKKWANGEQVQTKDVIFTINLINKTDSIYKKNIENIEKIEEIDSSTLKIYLKKPVDFFEYLLCFPILQEKGYNQEKPTGIGEYIIQNITEKQIIIKGNETKLTIEIFDSIAELYNAFTREKVDLIITQNTNYEEYIGNIGFEEKIITGREFYYISCENIENKQTRLVLNKVLNKEKLVYNLYHNKYVIAEFPLEYGSYLNSENNEEDIDVSAKNQTLTLSTEQANNKIAEQIKEQLGEVGINVIIQNYKNPNADLILKNQTVPITPTLKEYFEDEEIKEEISKIMKIENKEILKQEYKKIIDNYYEEQPFISLYFNSYIILHSTNLKGNFSGNWYNMFYNVDTWYKVQ